MPRRGIGAGPEAIGKGSGMMSAKWTSLVVLVVVVGHGAIGWADPYVPAYGNVLAGPGGLDLRIDGEGFLLLSDGSRDMLVREGEFSTGPGGLLYDRDYGRGMLLQRVGSVGEAGGYQAPGVAGVRITYDWTMPPRATTSVSFGGNLGPDAGGATRQILSLDAQFAVAGAHADEGTLLRQLDQARGLGAGDEIRIAGTTRAGLPVSAVMQIDPGRTTLGDLAAAISSALPGTTATIASGRLRVTDNDLGYSRTDLTLTYAGEGSLDVAGPFDMLSVGGTCAREALSEMRDYRGVSRVLVGTFVQTDQPGVWDYVVTQATGALSLADRRVEGITFNANKSFAGPIGPAATVEMTFPGGGPAMRIAMDFGTPGKYDGLSGFFGFSTADAVAHDGSGAGHLSSVLARHDGTLLGRFTNGQEDELARLAVVVPAPTDHPHPHPGLVVTRGDRLDLAIEGAGYFVVAGPGVTGQLREAAFVVDHAYRVADPATGLRLQRTGTVGEAWGFQGPGDMSIRIPYDQPIPARATTTIVYRGNLSADSSNPSRAVLGAGTPFTVGGVACDGSVLLAEVDQAAGLGDGDRIVVSGTNRRGDPVSAELSIQTGATTLGDLAAAMSAAFEGSTASVQGGELRLVDDEWGYSLTDVTVAYDGAGSMLLPGYFRMYGVGGEATRDTNMEMYDAAGEAHILSGSFVRSGEGEWDFVLTKITGELAGISDRRARGIAFDYSGIYEGIAPAEAQFRLTFAGETEESVLSLDFGDPGHAEGLVNFGGGSMAAPDFQDGWVEGWLSTMWVTMDGTLWGGFTNSRTVEIARIDVSVPEPASLAVLAAGVMVLRRRLAVRRRWR